MKISELLAKVCSCHYEVTPAPDETGSASITPIYKNSLRGLWSTEQLPSLEESVINSKTTGSYQNA